MQALALLAFCLAAAPDQHGHLSVQLKVKGQSVLAPRPIEAKVVDGVRAIRVEVFSGEPVIASVSASLERASSVPRDALNVEVRAGDKLLGTVRLDTWRETRDAVEGDVIFWSQDKEVLLDSLAPGEYLLTAKAREWKSYRSPRGVLLSVRRLESESDRASLQVYRADTAAQSERDPGKCLRELEQVPPPFLSTELVLDVRGRCEHRLGRLNDSLRTFRAFEVACTQRTKGAAIADCGHMARLVEREIQDAHGQRK